MSDIGSGLMLHLALDSIEDGKVLDSSSAGLNGTVRGNPQIVVDDKLGGCLALDGTDDSVIVPAAAIPSGSQLAITFWAFGGETLPKHSSLLQAKDASGRRILNIHLPFGNGNIYFDCGNDGSDYDRILQAAASEDYKGRWTHWTFVKDAGTGVMSIYKDGALWLSESDRSRTLPAAATVALGSALGVSNRFYHGRLAHFRVYNRVLSLTDIRDVMAVDSIPTTAFRRVYPLDFGIYDANHQPVLLIDEQKANQTLTLTLHNTSGQTVLLDEPADNIPTAQNHHLRLRFRPGTLSQSAIDAMQMPPGPWRMSKPKVDGNGLATVYLVNKGPVARRTLAAGEEFQMSLQNVSAGQAGGARITRAELFYQNLTYSGERAPISGVRQNTMRILHAGSPTAQQQLPLRAGFLGGNRVLNDGVTANTLQLRLANTGQQPIPLNGPDSDATTRLILSFVVGQDPAEGWWALGTAGQVAGIDVQAEGWTVREEVESSTPTWVLTPEQTTTLEPGAQIAITLSNLITDFAAGETQVSIGYENLSSYGDGQVMATIEKSAVQLLEPWRSPNFQGPRAEVRVAGVLNTYTYAFCVQTPDEVQIQREPLVPVPFEHVVHDPYDVFQREQNDHHFTAPIDGVYLFTATLEFWMNGEGLSQPGLFAQFEWGIYGNRQSPTVFAEGSTVAHAWTGANLPPTAGSISAVMQLDAGDQVTVHVTPPVGTLPFLVRGTLNGLLVSA